MALTKRKLIYPIFVILVFFGLLAISILFIQLRDLDALRDMVVQEIR
ncbi:MAG: hypothetical protein GWM98_17725, partial [Nitrospinaceae bacterium]|nr:hypothetical protein [Nitrospinaceae bacterium]NIR55989.1 hypothetical protein [Nitrospinaceae bacterium]NIS86432.1 hypothetical protein [Nitrospinaceae bacterium]NIT83270.1 hypothetical protein [Nitrospinaceae bacterium]NIU45477.1 hypothetical protein [Nitrospinaceae bacterium]